MPGTDHVLLTRFNLPTGGVEGKIRAQEGWLRDRVDLFERYTMPSVAAQTVAGLTWIVYLDPESPSWLLDRLRPAQERGLFRMVLRESVSREEMLSDISSAIPIPHRRELLLTSNVDNDDGLARDFAERLQAVRSPHPRVAIYLTCGLVRTSHALYRNTDRRNAFCSVRESWDAPVTAWGEYHNELGQVMPVVELRGEPAWLQVIHGANVSNHVRGHLVSPTPFRVTFGSLLDDLTEPRRRAVVVDGWVRSPVRSLRDGGRALLRRAGLRVFGKDGYHKIKERLFVVGGRSASG